MNDEVDISERINADNQKLGTAIDAITQLFTQATDEIRQIVAPHPQISAASESALTALENGIDRLTGLSQTVIPALPTSTGAAITGTTTTPPAGTSTTAATDDTTPATPVDPTAGATTSAVPAGTSSTVASP